MKENGQVLETSGVAEAFVRCVGCDAAERLQTVRADGPVCPTVRGGCGKATGFAVHLAWDRALSKEPLLSQLSEPSGWVLHLEPSTVDALGPDLAANLRDPEARKTALKALQEVLDAHGINLSAPESIEEGPASALTDDTDLVERADAYYARRTLANRGQKEWPVLARPLKVLKWLTVEGEIFVVMEDQGGRYVGTYGGAWRRLKENGQAFDPKWGERAFARLKADAVFAGDAPATFGIVEDPSGRLLLPKEFYPRPGHQADAIRDLQASLNVTPGPQDWAAWRDFFKFFHAREWMPLAGLAAIAPASLLFRTERVVIPAGYAYSRAGGTGKTSLCAALSSQLYGIEALSGDGVNSEFRFLGMLNAACLPRLVDEAERLFLDRLGAVLKAAMGSPHAGDRGNKDRTVEAYRSRAVPLFTSNARPPLSRPVLARFLMIPFDEERGSNVAAGQEFRRATEQLSAAGFALTAALVRLYPTKAALLGRHKVLSEAIARTRDRWDDSRRPGSWAAVYLGLEAWADASAGAIALPSVEAFASDVVESVERATFEEPVDALETLRGWLELWVQRNVSDRPNALTGAARLAVKDTTRLAGTRPTDARYVTKALLHEYNRDQQGRVEVQFGSLVGLAKEVQRQYGVAAEVLLDLEGAPRLHTMTDGSRQRAVQVPLEAPGTPAAREEDA